MNKKILIMAIVLLSAAMLISPLIGTAAACREQNEENGHEERCEVDNRLPGGAFVINYWTGGNGSIAVPASWPTGGVHSPIMMMEAAETQGTFGTGDSIYIAVPYLGASLPVALFTTNPAAVPFLKTFFSGMPPAANTISVSKSDLKVEMHGNRITAELLTPQQVLWNKPGPGFILVTIPAFKFELDKVDGSVHEKSSLAMTGYKGSSNFTVNTNQKGFNATGAFTCANWTYVANPMTDCFITKQGITTYVPPSTPGFAITSFSGGIATMNISTLAFSKLAMVTGLVVNAVHIESSTFGPADSLVLVLLSPGYTIPFAYISTNPKAADFMKTVYSGTGIYRKGLPGPPVVPDLDNTRFVTARELSVRRCGNHTIVDFRPRHTMTLLLAASPNYPTNSTLWPPFVLPAFHIEWDETGALVPSSSTTSLPKAIGCSGYTLYTQKMGFVATATFTCPVWNSQGVPSATTAASTTKYGITTFYPPL